MRFDALDTALFYVGHHRPDVLAPLLVRHDKGHETDKALLLFRSARAATPHQQAIGDEAVLVSIDENDFRAKEELLRAAIEQGASEVWIEPSPTLTPDHVLPIAKALFYILSFRREQACL